MCVNKNKRNDLIETLLSYILENGDKHPQHIKDAAGELLVLELKKHSHRIERCGQQEEDDE
mgnify:CR=1 FL=1